MLLYGRSLSHFLTEDLQLLVFWGGIILLFLTIVPIFEWAFSLLIYVAMDRELPDGSFSFWDTLNQTQWKSLLQDMYGDFYLFWGLFLIDYKLIFLTPTFIDYYPSLLPQEVFSSAIPLFSVLLGVIVVLRMSYRIPKNKKDVFLSQHYLSAIKSNCKDLPRVEEYYLNRAWPLMRKKYFNFYTDFLNGLMDSTNKIKNVASSDLEMGKFLEGLERGITELSARISEKGMQYQQILIEYDIAPMVGDIETRIKISRLLYANLLGLGQDSAAKFLRNINEFWDVRKNEIEEAIVKTISTYESRSGTAFQNSIERNWSQVFFLKLETLIQNLSASITALEKYVSEIP